MDDRIIFIISMKSAKLQRYFIVGYLEPFTTWGNLGLEIKSMGITYLSLKYPTVGNKREYSKNCVELV